MELFRIKRNGPMHEADSLYVRVLSGAFDTNSGALKFGSTISLDTYFNVFSTSKYLEWTKVNSAKVDLDIKGRMYVELICRKADYEACIYATETDGPIEIPFEFQHESKLHYYFLRLKAIDEDCFFYGGVWHTDIEPSNVHLAVIICTYRREDYILKNLASIRSDLLEPAASLVFNDIEIFVIDNGKSLKDLVPEHSNIRLFYNKNCGGSGGFTRGLIEVMKRKSDFTHVLFMDDDIVLDTNVILKTIQFLKLVRPEYADLHLAGGMLNMDKPGIQHEATARWDGNIHPNNADLDLSDPVALFENEREKLADYAAWWYLAFPLSLVDETNLPLPLFIKGDDIEYGLRNMKHVAVLNGVGVWHEGFVGKERPYLDYYIIRNYLIISSVHNTTSRTCIILFGLLRRMLRAVILDAPEIFYFITMAVEDYLAGPEFILQLDCERLNTELRESPQRTLPNLISKQKKIWALFKRIPSRMFWMVMLKWMVLALKYLASVKNTRLAYMNELHHLTSKDTWLNILKDR